MRQFLAAATAAFAVLCLAQPAAAQTDPAADASEPELGGLNPAGYVILAGAWGALDGDPPYDEVAMQYARARCDAAVYDGADSLSQRTLQTMALMPRLQVVGGDLYVDASEGTLAMAVRGEDGWSLIGAEALQQALELEENRFLILLYTARQVDPVTGAWVPVDPDTVEPEVMQVQLLRLADGTLSAIMLRLDNFEAVNSGEAELPTGDAYVRCGDLQSDLARLAAAAAAEQQ